MKQVRQHEALTVRLDPGRHTVPSVRWITELCLGHDVGQLALEEVSAAVVTCSSPANRS